MSEDKNPLINLVPDALDNAAKNLTDKPTQNMGTTFADIWYLVFGGISQAAEKRKLKYSYALQEFENELKNKIGKIPKDKLVEPNLQIIAPTLESAKYCIEEKELRKMFSDLISSLLNVDFYNNLHPFFPQILKQLSPFDAKLLVMIYQNNTIEFTKLIEEHINNFYDFIHYLSFSFINLQNLGLIQSFSKNDYIEFSANHNIFNPECLYEIVTDTLYFNNEEYLQKMQNSRKLFDTSYSCLMYFGRVESLDENLHFVTISSLGKKFIYCCYK